MRKNPTKNRYFITLCMMPLIMWAFAFDGALAVRMKLEDAPKVEGRIEEAKIEREDSKDRRTGKPIHNYKLAVYLQGDETRYYIGNLHRSEHYQRLQLLKQADSVTIYYYNGLLNFQEGNRIIHLETQRGTIFDLNEFQNHLYKKIRVIALVSILPIIGIVSLILLSTKPTMREGQSLCSAQ